jgi:RNA polymerase sigma-70 factor, ECF subfamily
VSTSVQEYLFGAVAMSASTCSKPPVLADDEQGAVWAAEDGCHIGRVLFVICNSGWRRGRCAVGDRAWLAERFERQRPQLRRIAYRMLGTLDESDDAVQETWLRLSRTDESAVENLGAWLTTVLGRVCLDMLRARRSRREDYVGSWLPEPIVTIDDAPDPEQEALIADSVGLALLVVLETLTPAERLALVLHDMFAVPFEQIAAVVGRSPAATRQLASRARRRVQGATPAPAADLTEQRRVADAFLAAGRAGNFDALIAVLDPDVVLRVDAGADSRLAQRPLQGAAAVAREALARARQFALPVRPALVNGGAGAVIGQPGRPFAVVAFTVCNGRITALDFVLDPGKLAHVTAHGERTDESAPAGRRRGEPRLRRAPVIRLGSRDPRSSTVTKEPR